MKQQNGTINLVKFLMAVGILLMHAGMLFGYSCFQGTWIFVEWFFIFAGYCVTKEIIHRTSAQDSSDFGKITFEILTKRIRDIYPYFFVACLLGLVIQLMGGSLLIGSVSDMAPVFAEFLMLQMTGLNLSSQGVVGTTWFLSSLWIALILFIPCVIKLKRYFISLLSLLIGLLIYGYLDVNTGCLWSPAAWMGFAAKGTLRAVAALCLGAFSWGLGEQIRNSLNRPRLESVFLCAGYLLVFLFTWRYEDSKWYFLFPLFFVLLISVGMTKQPGWDIPDGKATRFLGKISMLLFLNHAYVIFAIQKAFPFWSLRRKMIVSIVASFICMAISYFGGQFLRKIAQKIVKQRSDFI